MGDRGGQQRYGQRAAAGGAAGRRAQSANPDGRRRQRDATRDVNVPKPDDSPEMAALRVATAAKEAASNLHPQSAYRMRLEREHAEAQAAFHASQPPQARFDAVSGNLRLHRDKLQDASDERRDLEARLQVVLRKEQTQRAQIAKLEGDLMRIQDLLDAERDRDREWAANDRDAWAGGKGGGWGEGRPPLRAAPGRQAVADDQGDGGGGKGGPWPGWDQGGGGGAPAADGDGGDVDMGGHYDYRGGGGDEDRRQPGPAAGSHEDPWRGDYRRGDGQRWADMEDHDQREAQRLRDEAYAWRTVREDRQAEARPYYDPTWERRPWWNDDPQQWGEPQRHWGGDEGGGRGGHGDGWWDGVRQDEQHWAGADHRDDDPQQRERGPAWDADNDPWRGGGDDRDLRRGALPRLRGKRPDPRPEAAQLGARPLPQMQGRGGGRHGKGGKGGGKDAPGKGVGAIGLPGMPLGPPAYAAPAGAGGGPPPPPGGGPGGAGGAAAQPVPDDEEDPFLPGPDGLDEF